MNEIVRRASKQDIRHVFANVPPERAAELTASAWHDKTSALAEELLFVADYNGRFDRPAFMFAFAPHPGDAPLLRRRKASAKGFKAMAH